MDKRFLFWDDYRPVEYAKETIPTATLLSLLTGHPFEVQVPQSFHDGNVDFEWHRGAVVTAKEEGLWIPTRAVTAEDIRHMQSRFEVFRLVAQVPELRGIEPCQIHLARWVRDAAAAYDAQAALQAPLPLMHDGASSPPVPTSTAASASLDCMSVLTQVACVPHAAAALLERELLSLGATHMRELTADG